MPLTRSDIIDRIDRSLARSGTGVIRVPEAEFPRRGRDDDGLAAHLYLQSLGFCVWGHTRLVTIPDGFPAGSIAYTSEGYILGENGYIHRDWERCDALRAGRKEPHLT